MTGPPDFNVNGESNLDLQYAIALTYPTPVTLYQVGGIYLYISLFANGVLFNNTVSR